MLLPYLNAVIDICSLDRALYFVACFAAAEPLLQTSASRVNVLVNIFIDKAGSMNRVVYADAVLAAVFGSVLGFFAGGIIAPAIVVARIITGQHRGAMVMGGESGCRCLLGNADGGVMRVRVDDAAVDHLGRVTR